MFFSLDLLWEKQRLGLARVGFRTGRVEGNRVTRAGLVDGREDRLTVGRRDFFTVGRDDDFTMGFEDGFSDGRDDCCTGGNVATFG